MMSQIKTIQTPNGDIRVLGWSPQTDLRNCGVSCIRSVIAQIVKAFQGDDPANPRPAEWLVDYAIDCNCTVEQLASATETFARGFRIAWDQQAELMDALQSSGFRAQPLGAQNALTALIGRRFVGMTVWAIKETSTDDSIPFCQEAMDRMTAETDRLIEMLRPR